MPQDWEARNWGEQAAQRISREILLLRGKRSAQWLSDRTKDLGHTVSRSVITDLENGRRRYVTVSELIVLAVALEISPLNLLYPTKREEQVEFLADEAVSRPAAVQRFTGLSAELIERYEEAVLRLQESAQYIKSGAENATETLRLIQLENLERRQGLNDGG